MTDSLRRGPSIPRFFRPVFVALLTAVFAVAPFRVVAQASAAAGDPAPAASSPANGSAAAEKPKSEEEQEKAFLYSPAVRSVARVLHLNLETTVYIFLGINFAVIFLLITVPLGRTMPKVMRKRSQTLGHHLREAREATADAKARLSAVEAQLAGLGEEIARFRAEMEQEAREEEKRIKATLNEESARIVAAAEQEIGVAVAQAKRGLRSFAADLAIGQAAKQVDLTPETDRELIAEFIAGAGADGAGKGGKN